MSQNRTLDPQELDPALRRLPGWEINAEGHLHRSFRFDSFARAMGFMASAAIEADKLGHHPNWSNVYDRVDVELWSHELGGVSSLCVALAERMNELNG